MNVVHIISGDLWAGAEAQALAMLQTVAEIGAVATQVVTFNAGKLCRELVARGLQVEVIEEQKNHFMDMVLRMRRLIRERKIEIVHCHGYKETFVGGLAAKLGGVKAIVRTHHGKGVLNGGAKHRLIEWVNRSLLTEHNIAVSYDLKRYLMGQQYKEEEVTVIHNGINAANVKASKNPEDVRSELGIPHSALVIGSMGRLVPVKGYDMFIRGAREVVDKVPEAVFVLAGDGPLHAQLQSVANEQGIEKRVRFLGFRSDAYDVLSTFDIFALTSLHEGVPMVLLEAMAMAKPIVSTSVGGVPEIISDGDNGLLILSKDPSLFAQACLRLSEDTALRNRLGSNALRDVMCKHNTDVLAGEVLRLYQRVCG